MQARKRIFLIGPMGAGKTAIGKQLARELSLEFFDSDLVIQERTGVDVSFIFEKEGEQGFRLREKKIIDELTQRDDIVLATGGGAVLDAANREVLKQRGTVIYLQVSVDSQLARTRLSRNRPLLETDDPLERLQGLRELREPLYEETADISVKTDGRRVNQVTAFILKALDKQSKNS
ncbi:MAG: shikimate kinase AroK [Gammaproteobacteria bacterium]|nr:shikimate kinase AroK [Gammaproteobacteria bacterium]